MYHWLILPCSSALITLTLHQSHDNYVKADLDLNLSRAEVEKQRMNASIKNQNAEDFKNEYANQLGKTNTLQVDTFFSSVF